MSKYKIDSIRIFNFKVFDDYEINFKDSNLIALGGPNGFGKTSIFDALELGLTGDIRRFTPIDKSTGNGDNIVARDNDLSVAIKIELSDKANKKLIIKRVLKQKSSAKTVNKISNFKNLWKLVAIESHGERELTQQDFEEIIGETNFSNYYNNFFYIQQEETAHFLKKNEKERLEAISKLFNIDKEEKELKKVGELKKKVDNLRNMKEAEKKNLSETVDKQTKEESPSQYHKLLTWQEKSAEWDKEKLIFPDANTKDKYLIEIKRVLALLNNKEAFMPYYKIQFLKSDKESVKALLLGQKFWKNYDELLLQHNEKLAILKIMTRLDDIGKLLEKKPDFTFLHGKIEFDFESFNTLLDALIMLKENVSKSENLIRELVDFRNSLVEKFAQSPLDKKECPLCGTAWKDSEKLKDAIDQKKVLLDSLLKNEAKQFQEQQKVVVEEIKKLKQHLTTLLQNERYLINDQFVTLLKQYKNYEVRSKKFYSFLQSSNVPIDDLLVTDKNQEFEEDAIDALFEKTVSRLDKHVVFEDDLLTVVDENNLLEAYKLYFDSKEDNLATLTQGLINEKVNYIEQQYYQYNKDKMKQVEKLEKEVRKLKGLLGSLKNLEDIYKQQISSYRNKVIKDIEIPFYIYSGKILHSVRDNSTGGIFIKDTVRGEDKLNNIRFVSKWESDQDVINTTSSGQLAGIVIALTLTMNMVYAKNFSSLFIDDPVQSMDDINMISLVELLRNEFSDKQIFVSTHEESIEKYILYKFMKHNQNVCRIDLMTRENYFLKSKNNDVNA